MALTGKSENCLNKYTDSKRKSLFERYFKTWNAFFVFVIYLYYWYDDDIYDDDDADDDDDDDDGDDDLIGCSWLLCKLKQIMIRKYLPPTSFLKEEYT